MQGPQFQGERRWVHRYLRVGRDYKCRSRQLFEPSSPMRWLCSAGDGRVCWWLMCIGVSCRCAGNSCLPRALSCCPGRGIPGRSRRGRDRTGGLSRSAATALAQSYSEIQLSSTRSKNWTPSSTGRIPWSRSTSCGASALPHEGPERELRAVVPSTILSARRLDPNPADRHFHARRLPGLR